MEESPGKMYALAAVLSSLATLATGLRFYSRYIKKAGFSWDDYTVLPALLFTIVTSICMVVGSAAGDLGRHTPIAYEFHDGVDWPYPLINRRTVVFQQTFFAVTLSQVITFGFTKLSVLLFYQRIFQGRWIQNAVWFMVAITFLWTVGFFFSCLLVCYPISVNWTGLGWDPHYCVDSSALYISQAWSDVATDVVIMALPIPCIWTLQMPMQKKLAVCGIFLLGALTVAAGIAKMFVYYHAVNQMNDPSGLNVDISYIQTPLVYWPLVESSLGIIGACLPLMRPLFAGVASRGFMRDLRSVEIPTSEQSKTLWNSAEDSRAVEEWNSTISTVRFGSESAPPSFKEKRLPSLPASSLNMLRDTPSEGPWMKGPKVYHNMV